MHEDAAIHKNLLLSELNGMWHAGCTMAAGVYNGFSLRPVHAQHHMMPNAMHG